MGRVPVQRTFTIVGIFNVGSQVDEAMVFIATKDGAKLHRKKGDGVNQLRLYLDDAFKAPRVIAQLSLKYPDFNFVSWQESQGALFAAVSMEKNMMWLMLSLIVAVAAFNIVSALVMVVIDKQGEISILQTLGLDRSGIVKIFITQGLTNGILGVILGVTLGVILTLNLNHLFSLLGVNLLGAGQTLPIALDVVNILVIVASALVMSFLATLYPAYRAAQTQPAEVLRNE
jgi:lipoprotein-releasing system permease protein